MGCSPHRERTVAGGRRVTDAVTELRGRAESTEPHTFQRWRGVPGAGLGGEHVARVGAHEHVVSGGWARVRLHYAVSPTGGAASINHVYGTV